MTCAYYTRVHAGTIRCSLVLCGRETVATTLVDSTKGREGVGKELLLVENLLVWQAFSLRTSGIEMALTFLGLLRTQDHKSSYKFGKDLFYFNLDTPVEHRDY